jgi:hypothetical protein
MQDNRERSGFQKLMFGKGTPSPSREPMTRGQQTAWIIGAMVALAFLGWRYSEIKDDPCGRMFAPSDTSCLASMAGDRLARGIEPYR